jgi:formamidopyrimidine-DNA glycosylase
VPELPEVETVRIGLDAHVVGRQIIDAQQIHPRALNPKSISGLEEVVGSTVLRTGRRGKFLWMVLDRPFVLSAHLGMSGQFLIDAIDDRHTRAIFSLKQGSTLSQLHFNDQRTFGWVSVDELSNGVPKMASKIARDLFDPAFEMVRVVENISRREISIKTAILNQNVVSGIGNIYADESLWRAKIHPESHVRSMKMDEIVLVLQSARDVMADALRVGGTSFDQLYIKVNGESGYFDMALNVYGREGQSCPRCGTPIERIKFTNRSSHFCPDCQRI